ncbi:MULTISPECIES: Fic family protein [Oerskovia]|uniref:Fic family protein n=2 Tax=Oerskovia TaxID=162491 RepID=A0ABR8V1Q0_9CELL|nr:MULTISPECIES: Fic family protein [Oerskovia]MBD7998704.1 Fic family protein [Oerskovia gallyi]MBM7497406.1 Fic family protein [Oerskovia paurometabola]
MTGGRVGTTAPEVAAWPPHGAEVRPWSSTSRGPREDRMLREITVSLPPRIAGLAYVPSAEEAADIERAAVDITRLDAVHGPVLSSFATFLLRTEAVASSRIERHDASLADLARATIGMKSGKDAQVTVAAARAVSRLVDAAGRAGTIELDDLLAAHRTLLKDDPLDGPTAGTLRTVQNWIGGSDWSPRGAVHVPPPPELVPGYMEDLIAFLRRDDLPAVAQAAIAHAQFESIHPFTDGNGRIGRALIGAVWRRRGLAPTLVVPVASAMLADTGEYFARVNAYRDGRVAQFVRYLATSASAAAREARISADNLSELPAAWRGEVRPRAGSAAAALLDGLLDHPVLDGDLARQVAGTSAAAAYEALHRLTEAGVLSQLSTSQRHGVWAATEVLGEIDDLTRRLREA